VRICVVVRPWTRSYDTTLRTIGGERVTVGVSDLEAPEWRWCTTHDGLAGWVPEALLDVDVDGLEGVLREDYDAIELTVAEGETVNCERVMAGWGWCVDIAGNAGWVPLPNLA